MTNQLEKKEKLSLPQRLKRLREALNFSQREMAQEFRVVHGTIGLWESEQRAIPGPVVLLIELYENELGLAENEEISHVTGKHPKLRGRFLRLTTLGARMAGQMAWEKIKKLVVSEDSKKDVKGRAQKAINQQIVETMGRLKGLPMKIGQLMSYMYFDGEGPDPETFVPLQDTSPPMAASQVAEIIVEEFGKTPNQLFAQFSLNPFAAASIGQVHVATLRTGEKVAVKIQYPKIKSILNADMDYAVVIDKLGSLIYKGQSKGLWMEEMRLRFMGECDYKKEATNQIKFGELYRDHPGIQIPRVFEDYCRPRVLTTQLMVGQTFNDFKNTATQEEKNRAGELLWDFVFQSSFKHHLYNGDPHPGNFLFNEEGLICLDFGFVRELDPTFVTQWKKYYQALLHDDKKASSQLAVDFGVAPQHNPKFDFDYHHDIQRHWYRPLIADEEFEFTEEYVLSLWRRAVKNNPDKYILNTPREWIFLNQLRYGLYAMLAQLQAKSNWHQRVKQWIE